MTNELEPCPFCGGEAIYEATTDQMGHFVLTAWRVKCSQCFCGPLPNNYEGNKANAAKRWNTRYKRTCNVIIEDECAVCSECQEDIDPSWVACPYCGAEVIDGD